MRPFVVAIDGPAGAGKSATARGVAARLGLRHVDSGSMYRAIGCLAMDRGISLDGEADLVSLVRGVRFDFDRGELNVDGESFEDRIRTAEAGEAASRVAIHPALRKRLLSAQRDLARPPGVVMEGRDIGTVVFPDADLKIYLSASVEARVRRRRAELLARGEPADEAVIEAAVFARDQRDRGRATSPLAAAPDALRLDTTDLTIEEQVDLACHWAALARPPADRGPADLRAAKLFIRTFARVALGAELVGAEHIPPRGPLIVACNHISYWDPPLVGSFVPRAVHFVAKVELFENKLFGALIRRYNAFPIRRGPKARAGLRGAEQILARGGVVLIFPEGTRSTSGVPLAPRSGISHLAHSTRAPVIPARIAGSNQIRACMKRQTHVRIAFGPALMPPVRAGAGAGVEARRYARVVMDAILSL